MVAVATRTTQDRQVTAIVGHRPGPDQGTRGPEGRTGQQDHVAGHGPPPQRCRVEVGVAATDAQVEPVRGQADDLTGRHPVAHLHPDRGQVDVGRPQPVTVAHGHVSLADDRPRERDDPRPDGMDRRARDGAVLDAPVARRPAIGRRPEGIGHRGIDRGPVGTGTRQTSRADRRAEQDEGGKEGGDHGADRSGDRPHRAGPSRWTTPVRAARPACGCGAAGRPWCGSGSPGSRSRRGPRRSGPASGSRSSRA